MGASQRKRVLKKKSRQQRVHLRVRGRLRGTGERPRLVVHKSLQYIYAQVVDDNQRQTLVQANSREKVVREQLAGSSSTREAARIVGKVVATRAQEKGVRTVVFDRAGYVYHGRVEELAQGAREGGLAF